MRNTLKLVLIYILMVCFAVSVTGCSSGTYEGKELVDKAKQLHTELEAAHITVEDISGGDHTGPHVQEIWYRFVGDVMQYMYIGRDLETGEEYYEFNNGTELDTWHTGDAEWSFVAKGSEGYYSYSRTKRHWFADGALLLNDYAAAVSTSRIITFGDTNGVVLNYSDEALLKYQSMQGITGLEQNYAFDGDMCALFEVSYEKDGRDYKYLTMINAENTEKPVERIEPPAMSESITGEITEGEQ